MTTRPTVSPAFATDATFTSGAESGLAPRLDPGAGFKAQGWYPSRRVPARWFNWLVGLAGDWIQYLSQKTDGLYSPLNFAAVGNGTADDTTPLQACLTAAYNAARTGTIVDLGGLVYRITAKLDIYPGVHVRNGKIVMDHASQGVLHVGSSTSATTAAAEWDNVEIDFAQANSGVVFDNASLVVAVTFRNCPANASGLCTGRFFRNTVAGAVFRFEDCNVNIPVNAPGLRSDAGTLQMVRGRYTTPVAYADSVVEGTGGVHELDHVYFATGASTSGTVACVSVAGQTVIADACTFDDGAGNGNAAFRSTLAANTAKLLERGCMFLPAGDVDLVPYDLTNYVALGYSVDLLPHFLHSSNSADITIGNQYRTWSQRRTTDSTTPPVVTFEAPLFAGQEMDFILGNDHTSAWVGNVVLAGVSYDDADTALANLGANSSAFLTAHLVAHRYEGTLIWVVQHLDQVVLV